MQKYDYKISVIIPIYNVGLYLKETIDSIVNQSMGFKKNIQLILVNDGSTDDSEKICLEYKNQYPDNIVYLYQKNSGVSVARNNGIRHIKGKYTTFLDGDDKWSRKTFERVFSFFEKHYDEIDIVDCRVRYFDASNDYYIYDSRYKKSRVVDADEDYMYTLLNTATTFLKSSAISDLKFDTRLKYSEDTKFINSVLIKKNHFGIKHDALYLYRKRKESTSAVDNRLTSKEYYIGPLEYCFLELISECKKRNGCVTKNLQYLLLNNVLWRVQLHDYSQVLSQSEISEYFKDIKSMLDNIDDRLIINATNKSINNRLYLLHLKNNCDIWNKLTFDEDGIKIQNELLASTYGRLNVFRISTYNGKLVIFAKVIPYSPSVKFDCYLKNKKTNKKYYAEITSEKNWNNKSIFGEYMSKSYFSRFEIPINEYDEYEFFISYEDKGDYILKVSYGKLRFSNKYKAYKIISKKAILNNLNNNLIVKKYTFKNRLKSYLECQLDLISKFKIKTLLKNNTYIPVKRLGRKLIRKIIALKKLDNIIILESNPAFSDNVKMIFDQFIEHKVNDKYRIVWFVDNTEPFKDIKIKNVEFIKYFDPKNSKFRRSDHAIYCHKHAKIIIDSNRFLEKKNPKQIRIHMIHGSPIKNAAFYNLSIGDVDYLLTQAEFFKPMDSKIRNLPLNKVKPFGFPRNDAIFSNKKINFKPIDEVKVNKKILWLPTYRTHKTVGDGKNSLKYGLPCINDSKELEKLNTTLKSKNVAIFVKFHPAEDVSILKGFNLSNIIILDDEELKKQSIVLYELFYKFDALITDYSSVYFDFCTTKKNIGLAISDFDDYVKFQGQFQYNYKDIVIGNYMYNNKDLLEFVKDVSENKDKTYKERKKLFNRYDDYSDGKAAERIYEFLKKYL